jgi:Uma2 family endonuclease
MSTPSPYWPPSVPLQYRKEQVHLRPQPGARSGQPKQQAPNFCTHPLATVGLMSAATSHLSGAAPDRDPHANVTTISTRRAGARDPMYPDSDGKPMAENEVQLIAMITLITHLMVKFRHANVHVGGDQFWYPVQGSPKIVRAPDVYVVFGRPQLPARLSWRQWEEDDVGPEFVVEILSPSNSARDRDALLEFYERYGVREYVAIDPAKHTIAMYRRVGDRLVLVPGETRSDLVGVRFELETDEIVHYDDVTGRVPHPRDTQVMYDEQAKQLQAEAARADALSRRASAETARATAEMARADALSNYAEAEAARADRLAAQLRALGIDPDSVT